jgi:hypothetical protein
MDDRKKELEQWKEDHFGSSEGFDEAYGNDLDWQQITEDNYND